MTKPADTDAVTPATIAAAVAALERGELVAFPTETVYGLGADAMNESAIARVFAAKGRPADHPLIVHVSGTAELVRWARDVPALAYRLAESFWPGPLTLILRRAAGVPDLVTGGQDSVGLRCPAHPVAQRLLAACAAAGIHGLAAPSANRFGRLSPTAADHVREELGDAVAMVLDGGPCEVGIESTIVDLVSDVPRILRPGMIDAAMLAAVIGGPPGDHRDGAAAPRVPGSLAQHYAPLARLELLNAPDLIARHRALSASGETCAVLAREVTLAALSPRPSTCAAAADTPPLYARTLFATLRAFDAAGARVILVETPPGDSAWRAIYDRLQRAATLPGEPPTRAGGR